MGEAGHNHLYLFFCLRYTLRVARLGRNDQLGRSVAESNRIKFWNNPLYLSFCLPWTLRVARLGRNDQLGRSVADVKSNQILEPPFVPIRGSISWMTILL